MNFYIEKSTNLYGTNYYIVEINTKKRVAELQVNGFGLGVFINKLQGIEAPEIRKEYNKENILSPAKKLLIEMIKDYGSPITGLYIKPNFLLPQGRYFTYSILNKNAGIIETKNGDFVIPAKLVRKIRKTYQDTYFKRPRVYLKPKLRINLHRK